MTPSKQAESLDGEASASPGEEPESNPDLGFDSDGEVHITTDDDYDLSLRYHFRGTKFYSDPSDRPPGQTVLSIDTQAGLTITNNTAGHTLDSPGVYVGLNYVYPLDSPVCTYREPLLDVGGRAILMTGGQVSERWWPSELNGCGRWICRHDLVLPCPVAGCGAPPRVR